MKKGTYLDPILRSPKTIFTSQDIAMLWQEKNGNANRVRLSRLVNSGRLIRLRQGIYAKDRDYSRLELATRIFAPSYVSFEAVLTREGMIFQYHSQITLASYLSRVVVIDSQSYHFRRLKPSLSTNPAGIYFSAQTSIASPERALLDTLYSFGDYHFDNLRGLDWDKVRALLPIYQNQRLEKTVKALCKKQAKV